MGIPRRTLPKMRSDHGFAWLAVAALLGPCCGQQQGSRPATTVPVFGSVRDYNGEPVAGATVREVRRTLQNIGELHAARSGIGTRLGATATTDKRGKFVLKVAAGGVFGIVAMKGALLRSQVTAPAGPAGFHKLYLKQVVRVKGRITEVTGSGNEQRELSPRRRLVRSRGPVISGIKAQRALQTFGMIEEVECGDDGRFELAILNKENCQLMAAHTSFEVVANEWREQPYALQCPVRKVRSKVVNNLTGEPVTAAQIHLQGTTQGVAEDGSFEVFLPDNYIAPITAPGFYTTSLSAGFNTSRIGMPEGPKAKIIARNADGTPASNLELFTSLKSRMRNARLVRIRHVTDAAGGVTLTRQHQGSYWVWANLGGRLVRMVEVPGGTGDIEIPISTKTYVVHGTVIRVTGSVLGKDLVDGLGMPHVPVFVTPDTKPMHTWSDATVPVAYTDHGGKFTIPALTNQPIHIGAVRLQNSPAIAMPVQPKAQKQIQIRVRHPY